MMPDQISSVDQTASAEADPPVDLPPSIPESDAEVAGDAPVPSESEEAEVSESESVADPENVEAADDTAAAAETDEAPAEATAAAPPATDVKPTNRHWYVVKVQSGREETVKEAIERKVKIEGLEEFFGQVVVPMERETVTIQTGKRKGQKTVKKKKKFPGYVMAEVEFNDKILYLFRDVSGVGDFVGASLTRAPTPMTEREVQRMLMDQDDVKPEPGGKKSKKIVAAPAKLMFNLGDRVRVREGMFAGQEGVIKLIREPKDETETHKIRVELTVFGRPAPVELEHWQIENV